MAPKIKVYRNADSRDMYPHEVASLTGTRQGNYVVTAATKAAAAEHLHNFPDHRHVLPGHLRLAELDEWSSVPTAVRELLVEPGVLLYVPSPVKDRPVIRHNLDDTLTILGTWDYIGGWTDPRSFAFRPST